MKTFLISDNRDTALGMRLAGISGVIVHGRDETLDAFNKAVSNREIGILIITELAMENIQNEIKEVKLKKKYPLIVEIQDRHGQRRPTDYITGYIKESVGIKIWGDTDGDIRRQVRII